MKRLFFLVLLIGIASCSQKVVEKQECSYYSIETCPKTCVVCPPCEICSSLTCQTQEFCENIGFSKDWYENLRN